MLLRAPCCTPPLLSLPRAFHGLCFRFQKHPLLLLVSYASSGQICLCWYASRLSSAQQSSSSCAESRN